MEWSGIEWSHVARNDNRQDAMHCVTASEAATRAITLPAYSMRSQRTFNSYYTALVWQSQHETAPLARLMSCACPVEQQSLLGERGKGDHKGTGCQSGVSGPARRSVRCGGCIVFVC